MYQGDSFDDINARYIYIGCKDLGCDLGVIIRVSDTQVYFWSLDLTPDNLIRAKLALDEDEDNKVNAFSAIISEGKIEQYRSVLTRAYGTPHQTTFMGALNGRWMSIEDDPSGDCYAWQTDKSLIVLDGNMVEYWSLY